MKKIKLNLLHYAMIIIIVMVTILWVTKSGGDTIVHNNVSKVDSLRSAARSHQETITYLTIQKDSLEGLILTQTETINHLNIDLKNKDSEIESILEDIDANDVVEDSTMFTEDYGQILKINDSLFGITEMQMKEINKNSALLKKKNEYILIQSRKIIGLEELKVVQKYLISNQKLEINALKEQLRLSGEILVLKDDDLERLLKNHKKELRNTKWKTFSIGALAGGAATLILITIL